MAPLAPEFIFLHLESDDASAEMFRTAFEALDRPGKLIRCRNSAEAMHHILLVGPPHCFVTPLKEVGAGALQLISWIKNNNLLHHVPIFVCDPSDEPRFTVPYLALSIGGYVKGPIGPKEVESIVLRTRQMIERMESQSAPSPFRRLVAHLGQTDGALLPSEQGPDPSHA